LVTVPVFDHVHASSGSGDPIVQIVSRRTLVRTNFPSFCTFGRTDRHAPIGHELW